MSKTELNRDEYFTNIEFDLPYMGCFTGKDLLSDDWEARIATMKEEASKISSQHNRMMQCFVLDGAYEVANGFRDDHTKCFDESSDNRALVEKAFEEDIYLDRIYVDCGMDSFIIDEEIGNCYYMYMFEIYRRNFIPLVRLVIKARTLYEEEFYEYGTPVIEFSAYLRSGDYKSIVYGDIVSFMGANAYHNCKSMVYDVPTKHGCHYLDCYED